MTVWWKTEPLTVKETVLTSLVFAAHGQSATRTNLSADAVVRAAVGSGNYFQAMSAALMTLGGSHGPVEQTISFLKLPDPAEQVANLLSMGHHIPGWGNSFHKGEPDKLWEQVDEFLQDNYPEWHEKLSAVTKALHAEGKNIFPNPSAYTAVAAIILGMPKETAAYLLVAGRLAEWTKTFQRVIGN